MLTSAGPFKKAAKILEQIEERGILIRFEDEAMILHDPQNKLDDELKSAVERHKVPLTAVVLYQATQRMMRALDMAQPAIREGLKEEYAAALLGLGRLVGDPWKGYEGPESISATGRSSDELPPPGL